MLSPQRRFRRFEQKHMRPSAFLNEFEVSALSSNSSVKKELNLGSDRSIETTISPQYLASLSENQSQTFLPTIEEKQIEFQGEIGHPREAKKRKIFQISNQSSPMTKSNVTIRLPTIISAHHSPQPKKPHHKRNFTNVEDLLNSKKVQFRKSIQVIDFVNNVITKDQIDGTQKPLTKKILRQHTKLIRDQQ